MKKKILPILFSLFLLASCGEDPVTPCEKHNYGKWETTVEAKCGVAGSKERVCTVCGNKEVQEIKALEHSYKDAADQTGGHAATCKDDGLIITECKNCGEKSTRVEAKSDSKHAWSEWDITAEASCGAAGSKRRTCAVCNAIDIQEIPALDHTYGDTPALEVAGEAGITTAYKVYDCSVDHAKKLVWNAGDVTAKCSDGYEYNGKHEANIVSKSGGYQFYGRPKGNGVVINNSGDASSDSHVPVLDETVKGNFFEFRIMTSAAIEGAQLMAELTSASYLNEESGGLFKGVTESADWTPGIVADAEDTRGYHECAWRYEIMVNDAPVDMIDEMNIYGASSYSRGWYNFPCKLDLSEGENVIRITMTGGWKHTFFNFGLVTPSNTTLEAPTSQGFEVTFEKGDHVKSVTVYKNKKCTMLDEGPKFYTRTENGLLINDGDESQISFAVEVDEGYAPRVEAEKGKYKNIKDPSGTSGDTDVENVFRITKVNDNIKVTVSAVSAEADPDASKVTFVLKHCTVKVLVGEYVDETTAIDTRTDADGKYFTRLKDGGFARGGSAQVNFIVVPDNGYKFEGTDNITVVGEIEEFKVANPDVNAVKVKKVASDLTITVTCVAA